MAKSLNRKQPPSLPAHWPHPSAADLEDRPQRVVTIGKEQEFSFCNNSVKTSKYEWYSFIPLFLLEEFNPRAKIANCYFLVIACLQSVRPISNTDGYPTFLIPLTAVLLISALFKGLEDRNRHIADRKANSTQTRVFDTAHAEFRPRLWSEVRVGDLVQVHSREGIPADLVVLQVSEPSPDLPKGICYVETKSLDGETNLKMRNVVPALLGQLSENADLQALRGSIEMEHPNNLIDTFTGVISLEIPSIGKCPINPINVILRGCVLRSTEWMVGLVVNTGHDVKIMQSNMNVRPKFSNLDHQASRQIIGVIAMLLAVAFTGATAQAIFNSSVDIRDYDYLEWDQNAVGNWFIQFFYNLLLHASMIPVSLYVSMAIIRFTQAYFMNADAQMYYAPLDAPAAVRTMTLNEELGQVSHIFSDKTGTLTCNNMNFRKASINGVSYGLGITEIGKAAWKLLGKEIPPDVLHAEIEAARSAVPHVAFYDPQFYLDYSGAASSPEQRDLDALPVLVSADGADRDPHSVLPTARIPSSTAAVARVARQESDREAPADSSRTEKSVGLGASIRCEEVDADGDPEQEPPSAIKQQKQQSSHKRPGHGGSRGGGVSLSGGTVQQRRMEEFFRFLSVCHEVVPEHEGDGQVKLSAPNPDDEALVAAAAFFGYEFRDQRDKCSLVLERARGRTLEMEVLYVLPFTSARRRMSVVIRDVDHKIRVVSKGADSMMFSRLADCETPHGQPGLQQQPVGIGGGGGSGEGERKADDAASDAPEKDKGSSPARCLGDHSNGSSNAGSSSSGGGGGDKGHINSNTTRSTAAGFRAASSSNRSDAADWTAWASQQRALREATAAHINRFSGEGLRCLVLAAREVGEEQFADWSRSYDEANTSLVELDKRKRGLPNDIDELEDLLESGLSIVGATAIEDRLQEGVPDCIEKLVSAGIKVWVLTGDKEETAINIAVACNLVLPKEYMKQVVVSARTTPDLHTAANTFRREIDLYNRKIGKAPLRSSLSPSRTVSASALAALAESVDEGEGERGDRAERAVQGEVSSVDESEGDEHRSGGTGGTGIEGSGSQWRPRSLRSAAEAEEEGKRAAAVAQQQLQQQAGRGKGGAGGSISSHSNYSSSNYSSDEGDVPVEEGSSGASRTEVWKPRALIIDGQALIFIMSDPETRALLLQFSQTCQAVVCCRVSPDQKREIVDLVKDNVPGVRTLAVGDGANDVAMITAAHIGVGIKGEEGVQAVNASDYAVAQFRFLAPLLLKHGRYNYIRMSNLVCYMFYKNIFNSLTLFWFNFLCAFSGQKLYTEAAIQFFNLFYTSLPILLYGTYDKDLPVADVMCFPQLYTPCIHNAFFNAKVFWGWIGNAVLESVLLCILPFYLLSDFDFRTGQLSSFMEPGALCFTAVIIVVNMKMFLIQSEWYVLSVVVLVLSVGTWIGVAYIVSASELIDWDFYFVWSRMLQTGMFWLSVLLLSGIVATKDLLWVAIRRFILYDPRIMLQELSAYREPVSTDPPIPVNGSVPGTGTGATGGGIEMR